MSVETKPSPSTNPTDWEAVERDYRAGVKTLRQMADAHGVSHTGIRKRAEREGWTRDLSEKIAAEAEAIVRREAIPKESYTKGPKSEREIVESNALAIAQVRIGHRKDIQVMRGLVNRFLAELDDESDAQTSGTVRDALALLRKAEDGQYAALATACERIVALPGRVKTLKDLGETMRTVIGLEREAYGIKVEEAKDDSLAMLATSELFKLRQELGRA